MSVEARLSATVDSGRARSLRRGMSASLLIQVGGAGLKYLSQLLFARWLGAQGFGVYALTWAVVQLTAQLSGLGFPGSSLRFIPQYLGRQSHAHLRGFGRIATFTTLAAACLAGGLVWALSGDFWAGSVYTPGAGLIPLVALLALQVGLLRGYGRITLAFLPQLVLQPALVILACLATVWLTGSLTLTQLFLYLAVSLVAAIVLQQPFVRGSRPQATAVATVYDARRWFATSIGLLWVGGSLLLLNQVDILAIGWLFGPQDAGVYAAAVRTASLVGLVLIAINAVVAPRIAAAYHSGEPGALDALIAQSTRWMTVLTAVGAVAICLAGPLVLALFGPEFARALPALYVLALGQLLNAACGPVGYLLSMTGHERSAAQVYAVSAVINVGLTLLLGRLFGLVGAASATALTTILWNVWLTVLVVRRLGVTAPIGREWRQLMGGRWRH